MAIAFVNAADLGDNGGSTNSLTVAYTVGSGANRLLVVLVVGDILVGADDITGVTYAGAAMTLAAKTPASNAERFSYLYYLFSPASGSNNVIISSTGTHYLLSGAADYTGVAAVIDAALASVDASPNDAYASSITTVLDNCWVICAAEQEASSVTAGAGSTLRTFGAAFTDWGLFDSNGPVQPAGSYSMSVTMSQSNPGVFPQSHIMASFAPTVTGGRPRGVLNFPQIQIWV